MLAALFSDPARIASEWYRWGVAPGLAVTLVTTLWIFYDSQRRELSAPLWRTLSLVSALVVAPGAVLSLFPALAVGVGDLPILLAYFGIFATLVSLVVLVLYAAGVGVSPLPPVAEQPYSEALTEASPVETSPTIPPPTITRVTPASPSAPPPLSRRPDAAPLAPTQVMGSQTIDLSPVDDRTRVLLPEATQPLPLAWLVVMNGHRAGKEFRLDMLTDIGRDSRYNPASVEDPTMSRQHARVRLEKEGFVIYDLASANGVLVNGQKEQRCRLVNGDRITIGQTVFGFMIVAEHEPSQFQPSAVPAAPAAGGVVDIAVDDSQP